MISLMYNELKKRWKRVVVAYFKDIPAFACVDSTENGSKNGRYVLTEFLIGYDQNRYCFGQLVR
jgi:hypothetical protein